MNTKHILISLVAIFFTTPVLSVIAIDQPLAEGLRDVKAPVYFPPNTILLILVLIVIIATVIIFLSRFLKRKKVEIEQVPVDTRTSWEIAYEQFDALEKSSLLNEGQFKSYYSQLSGIVRLYFENRFSIRAPEMTTEEFLWSLEESRHLTADQNDTLKQFLSSCDIVKFAKFIPGIEEGKASFQLARKLVDETKTDSSETDSASSDRPIS